MQRKTHVTVLNTQYNTPLGMYSPEAVAEILARQTTLMYNGAVGIDFRFADAPNLANSEVLKMIESDSTPPRGTTRSSRQSSRSSARSDQRWPPPRSSSRDRPRDLSRDREIPKVPRPCSLDRPGGRDLSRERGVGQIGGVPLTWPPEPTVPVGAAVISMGALNDSQAYTQVRKVAWPPKSPHTSFDQGEELRRSMSPLQSGKVPPPVPPKPGRALDMNNGDHTNDFQESFSGSPVPPQLVSHPLRDEAPLNQSPSPIVASHPVVKTLNSSRKSGDQVWPPVREEVVSKNPEVSMSPLMRPKKVSKDYNNFFNQNAIPKTFPSYRAPPGTQHFTAENNGITQH